MLTRENNLRHKLGILKDRVIEFHAVRSRVGRGNLVLNSIPHILVEFWRRWVLSGGDQRHALP